MFFELTEVSHYPPSEVWFRHFVTVILRPALFPCWWGVLVLSRRLGVLVSGVFLLFALVSSHLCGFIHLSSEYLLTFWLGLWVDAQIVDDEVFLLLGFSSTSLAPLPYNCWGPLQALLVWGAPVAAAEQWGMLPVSFSAVFVPGWCLPNVSLLDIKGSGSCLRRQSVLFWSSIAELWALFFIQGC